MDENLIYFKNILPRLKSVYMHECRPRILKMIARRIHATSLYPSDWKDFAAEIGLNDPRYLEDIEISATTNKELPLYIAFCGQLQYNYTFHDVVKALINLERLDILTLIREEFEDFWEEWERRLLHHQTCTDSYLHNHNSDVSGTKNEMVKSSIMEENPLSLGLSSEKEPDNNESNVSSCEKQNYVNENKECKEEKDSSLQYVDFLKCHKKLEDIPTIKCSSKPLLGSSACVYLKELNADILNCKTKTSAENSEKLKADTLDTPTKASTGSKTEKLKVAIPKSPGKLSEPLTIFIPYVQSISRTGIQFANHLRKNYDCRVLTISEAEFMIRIDRSSAICAILQKVDFVVPIISEEYILCVRPREMRNHHHDAITNRFIFTWVHSEFENNYSNNFRVKPVVVEGFDRQLIRNEPIFQWVHQLWDEVDSLVEVLHKTKKMKHYLTAQWNQEKFVQQWMDYLNQN